MASEFLGNENNLWPGELVHQVSSGMSDRPQVVCRPTKAYYLTLKNEVQILTVWLNFEDMQRERSQNRRLQGRSHL